ncbi:ABC transporter permease [Ileibacterium valens]|uniref:ABC transmembrane type-1 domain-containing protein n=1 Tax=Ileibacterium valens TaxID=1862668 RepID=A0A1U7NHD6_9FIRM|nr:ABC transporter permease subunit [Ileibacterium valens]OLU36230.1 hypothetical protein BO224_12800 [Erysipelotrichaceae bacterium NYU-BL-E8]OLU37180.1 hypothetical protein BM735_11140 [Erysipelotrichaceae bacterium NYU-BL-F16]OLU41044.1 hypothetical protein BO222_03960 [Ileibacterium valens]
MKKWIRWIALSAVLISIWQIASLITDNSLICPSIFEIIAQMIGQASSPVFYQALGMTLARCVIGLFLSFILALLAGAFSFWNQKIGWVCDQLCALLQSIPNVAFIILLLFWTGRNEAVVIVQILLLTPMIFRELHEGLKDIARTYHEVFVLYPQPLVEKLKKAALPMLEPMMRSSLKSAGSLGLKAVVMAEILASVSNGIGRQLQSARLNLNFAGVLGWVLWLMLISLLLEQGWNALFAWLEERSNSI